MLAFLLVGPLLMPSMDGLAAQNPPQATPPVQSSEDIRILLEERCSGCHGPESEKRKALRKWSNAHDLAATAADPKLIVPGDPDGSDLYGAIDFDEMPPEDSDELPLTAEEKKRIFDWISAGAVVSDPVPAPSLPTETAPVANTFESEAPASDTSLSPTPKRVKKQKGWMDIPFVRWLGHFHPIVVHFPIALLSVAILAEMLARLLRRKSLRETADFCLVVGILSSIPAAAMGWFLAADTSHRGTELDLHRWLGTSIPLLSIAALVLMYKKPKLRIPCFLVLAAVVGATGHLGGGLTFGTDWLDWPG